MNINEKIKSDFDDFSNDLSDSETKVNLPQKRIEFVVGKEYKIHIVDEESNISEDFFYDVYCKAFSEVKKIVNENMTSSNNQKNIIEAANNIICFCGERGQGKSSAMLSFSNLLKNINNKNIDKYFSSYTQELKDTQFHILSRIDPTEFEKQQSILSVIISRMFFDFKEQFENSKNLAEQNENLELFQQCYKNINLIKTNLINEKNNYYDDDLETLSNLSDSANIKNDFYKLVCSFLKFMGNKDCLVIQIDDTDLNVEKAYDIVEDIRKYFMMPRVIVLMATKLEQLTKAIEQKYLNSFFKLLDTKRLESRDFHNMATKYIMKLIPGSRCIILPEIALNDISIQKGDITIKYLDYTLSKDNPKELLSGDLEEEVLEYIHRKTGLIFLKSDNGYHNIIPKTARGLANFLSILNGMKDIEPIRSFENFKRNQKEIDTRLKNINKFEEYFFNTWVEENVDITFIPTLKEWVKAHWEVRNKLIISYISQLSLYPSFYLPSSTGKNKRTASEREYSIEPNLYTFKKTYNAFALSDILDVLNKMDDYNLHKRNTNYTFAVRVFITILLNKLMLNQMVDEKDYSTDFIGDVFGGKVNRFLIKENNKYNRGKFSFSLTDQELMDMNKLPFANVLYNLFISDTKQNVEKKDKTTEYTFNIAQALVNLLKPYEIFNEVKDSNKNLNLIQKFKYGQIQYMCFQIVSNADVLMKLEKELTQKNNLNPQQSHTDHIIDFFTRIEDIMAEMKFLSQNNIGAFRQLKQMLKDSSEWVNFVFSKRYVTSKTYVNKYSKMLRPYQNTTTFELLQRRLNETRNIFNEITQLNIIDLSYENQEIAKRLNNIDKYKNFAESTYKNHQAEINKLRKSALDKLENMEE